MFNFDSSTALCFCRHWKNVWGDFSVQLEQKKILPSWCDLLSPHSLAASLWFACHVTVPYINHASQPARCTQFCFAQTTMHTWPCFQQLFGHAFCWPPACLVCHTVQWMQQKVFHTLAASQVYWADMPQTPCSLSPPFPGTISGIITAATHCHLLVPQFSLFMNKKSSPEPVFSVAGLCSADCTVTWRCFW